MSGLEALGLACSIFQVVTFARDTIEVAKKVHQNGSFDSSLRENADHLNRIADGMNSSARLPASSSEDQQLLDVSRKCQGIAKSLMDEVARLDQVKSSRSWITAARTTVRVVFRSRKLKELERKLTDIERVMQTGLLERTFQATRNLQVDLESLDSSLRHFIAEYQKGYRNSSDLILKETAATRQQVVVEAETTRTRVDVNRMAVEKKMNSLKQQEDEEHDRKAFLESFHFTGMQERRNTATRSHEETFQWIFHDEHRSLQVPFAHDRWTDSDSDTETESSTPSMWEESEESTEDEALAPEIRWDSLAAWLESEEMDQLFYWILGKPGSGKTTLVNYILNRSRTLWHLQAWTETPIIISHFIWKLGSLPLQKNLKGLLCSLLYQLLESDPDMLGTFARRQNTPTKRHNTDWPMEDLLDILQSTVHDYKRSVCIFIDGIDELTPQNDTNKFFQIVDSLKQNNPGKLKVCIAGRPEPMFKRRFEQAPRLQLHDLTRDDIAHFVSATLAFPASGVTEDEEEKLISLIVSKADGVFLWAHLVVNNLSRGLSQEDDYLTLEARITRLPSGLKDLYQDMWSRMNDDDDVYQEKAVSYLRLMVHFESSHAFSKRPCNPALIMLLSTDQELCHSLCQDTDQLPVSISELVEGCHRLLHLAETRSAGFLERFYNSGSSSDSYSSSSRAPWKHYHDSYPLKEYADGTVGVRFVHRTAKDYLCDTPEGMEILSRDKVQDYTAHIWLTRAHLACCQLFGGPGWWNLRYFIHEFAFLELLSVFDNESTRKEAYDCVDLWFRLCDRGKLLAMTRHYENLVMFRCGRERIYLDAAHSGLTSWVLRSLNKECLSTALKSRMLLNIGCQNTLDGHSHATLLEKAHHLSAELMRHGADPNFDRSIDLEESAAVMNCNSRKSFRQTPWVRFLAGVWTGRFASVLLVHLLKTFIDCGADLQTGVSFVLHVWENGWEWSETLNKAKPSRYSRAQPYTFVVQLSPVRIVNDVLSRLQYLRDPVLQDPAYRGYLKTWAESHGVYGRSFISIIEVSRYPRGLNCTSVQGGYKEGLEKFLCQCLPGCSDISEESRKSIFDSIRTWHAIFGVEVVKNTGHEDAEGNQRRKKQDKGEGEERDEATLNRILREQGQLSSACAESFGELKWSQRKGYRWPNLED